MRVIRGLCRGRIFMAAGVASTALILATGARAGSVATCSGGPAGVICTDSTVAPTASNDVLVSGCAADAGFDGNAASWTVTFWFRAGPDQPGYVDHGLAITVSVLQNQLATFTGVTPPGHYYWAWATLDKHDGSGPHPLYVDTDQDLTWRTTELVAVVDPNATGGPDGPQFLTVSQYTQQRDGTPINGCLR